jgi:hypothetical protein
MKAILEAVVGALFAALRPRAILFAENLVLRQQLAILRRATPRPRLRPIDRAFWVIVSRLWSRWAECLAIVQPGTVIAWHRRGFARRWAWKSRDVARAKRRTSPTHRVHEVNHAEGEPDVERDCDPRVHVQAKRRFRPLPSPQVVEDGASHNDEGFLVGLELLRAAEADRGLTQRRTATR